MNCPCGGSCRCHVGGAFRPACDIAGGCGSATTSTLCVASGCDRTPFGGSQLICGKHYAALNYALAACLESWRWLGDQLAGGRGGGGPHVSGTPEDMMPIRGEYSDHRTTIRTTVDRWARTVATANSVQGPFASIGTKQMIRGPSMPLDDVCRWLVQWLPWCAAQPWVVQMLDELRDAADTAGRLAPRGGRAYERLPLPCPDCGSLALGYYADVGMVECRRRLCRREMSLALYRQLTITTAAAASTAEPGPTVAA